MIYKITITHTSGWNGDKAEVGMNVEISSKQLSIFFGHHINPRLGIIVRLSTEQ